jgi:hypothetical protein
MVELKHSLNFVSEIDETSRLGKMLISLPADKQKAMLEDALKDAILPTLLPELERINEGASWAILKVVK